ncbi:hypothetical protein [Aliivibrio kagoshimensis]
MPLIFWGLGGLGVGGALGISLSDGLKQITYFLILVSLIWAVFKMGVFS